MTNVLSIEERQARDSEFVDEFINNGGNATQAAVVYQSDLNTSVKWSG